MTPTFVPMSRTHCRSRLQRNGKRRSMCAFTKQRQGDHAVVVPDPSDSQVIRMVERHRRQLVELLTNYGKIDMMCLDMWLGPRIWPEVRNTLLMMRKLQPDVMLRNRGIGNYGDYYTPERVVPR